MEHSTAWAQHSAILWCMGLQHVLGSHGPHVGPPASGTHSQAPRQLSECLPRLSCLSLAWAFPPWLGHKWCFS